MRTLLLDSLEKTVSEVEAATLEDYYRLLHCETIDVVQRMIGDKWYDIICDDEGAFVDDPKISAVDEHGRVMLVGNLLICGRTDADGELTSLSDVDVCEIKKHIKLTPTRMHPEGLMICEMSY